jgi:hypothetical protein
MMPDPKSKRPLLDSFDEPDVAFWLHLKADEENALANVSGEPVDEYHAARAEAYDEAARLMMTSR